MKPDILRMAEIEINRQQLDQLLRMLNKILGKPQGSQDFCVEGHRGISRRSSYAFIEISSKLLEPTGRTFLSDCLTFTQTFSDREQRKFNTIIRAVFQPQVNWTCTKLPNIAKLSELVNTMEPETGWSVAIGSGDIGYISIMREEYLNGVLALFLDQYHPYELTLWSDILKKEAEDWLDPINDSGYNFEISGAITRLNRFLPHLIKLAGGKVKFE